MIDTSQGFALCHEERLLLLTSSGMDSMLLTSVALAYGNIFQPLFLSFGFPWEADEYRHLIRAHEVMTDPCLLTLVSVTVSGDLLGDDWIARGEVPQWENGILTNSIVGRNICMLSLAATAAVSHGFWHLCIGISSHSYADAQEAFLKEWLRAAHFGVSDQLMLYYPLPSASDAEIASFVADHPAI